MEALRAGARAQLRQLLRSQGIRTRTSTSLFRSQIQPTFRTRPSLFLQAKSIHQQCPKRPTNPNFQATFNRSTRRWASEDAALDSTPDSQLSLSQRLKKLSREYGWTALYVYLGLSALDFPFCFLAVKLLGTDLIGHWEHVIVGNVKAWLQWPLGADVKQQVSDAVDKVAEVSGAEDGKRMLEEASDSVALEDHGYKEAEKAAGSKDATIWTQLALAYAIHKSFIFVRVPLTAAILPKVVKTLRGWGWKIGRPTRKGMTPSGRLKAKPGVNTKGTGVKPDD